MASSPQFLDGIPLWLFYLLTVGIAVLSAEAGYRLGTARLRRWPADKEGTLGSIVGATLALLAFLLAFLTGLALGRYDTRRELVVAEANAIGTTWLRAAYLEEPHRSETRGLLKEYVDARLDAVDPDKLSAALARATQIHDELWAHAVVLAKANPESEITALFIQTLNDVIDLHTKRVTAANARLPITMWLVIAVIAILAMFLVGLQDSYHGSRHLIALVVLILVFASVVLLIADLDRSQEGFLRVSQQPLLDLQAQMSNSVP